MPQDLVTTNEAARLLQIDRSTLIRWSSASLQPEHRRLSVAQKLPGKTGASLFHRSDIERLRRELVAERTARTVPPAD